MDSRIISVRFRIPDSAILCIARSVLIALGACPIPKALRVITHRRERVGDLSTPHLSGK